MTRTLVELEPVIRNALDTAAIIARTNVKGEIIFVNKRFCEISGYSESELLGQDHRLLRSGQHDKTFFRAMYRDIARGRTWHGEICNRRKDGSLYWVDTTIVPHFDDEGKPDSYTAIRFDITQRKQIERELQDNRDRLEEVVNTDDLTGIPNRRHFQHYLTEKLAEYGAASKPVCLALLDLDFFKEVNDMFGHDAGDRLLQILAERLRGLASERVFIARLGGDEFAMVLTGMECDEVAELLRSVLEAVRAPFSFDGGKRHGTASMGVAYFPEHAEDPENLFKQTDIALYNAKDLGRDRCVVYRSEFRDALLKRNELLAEIEAGLEQDQFELFYQPLVKPDPDMPASLEALLRWHHPRLGTLSPVSFTEAMKEPGIQAAIGTFVMRRAIADCARFISQGLRFSRIAINLTNGDLRSDAFINMFFELCDKAGISPSRFSVEVTEGMFLAASPAQIQHRLSRFHQAGVEIALDDFGTGYASLSHLRQLPFDRLKIDRSFVANILKSHEDLAIVRGIVGIAHSLGKRITAEGVETREQAELLLCIGCNSLQGWYFSKAVPAGQLSAALAAMPDVPVSEHKLQQQQQGKASLRN